MFESFESCYIYFGKQKVSQPLGMKLGPRISTLQTIQTAFSARMVMCDDQEDREVLRGNETI